LLRKQLRARGKSKTGSFRDFASPAIGAADFCVRKHLLAIDKKIGVKGTKIRRGSALVPAHAHF